ncbi:hypothetical protein Y1Q_0017595 [Alligator mississippiensis]|uniref:Uncharacterized protein n=1 Tax=Alligator mississippiensis TaxID=8496 RepID=A0A151P2X0_ALLMI|nr:hypothetical protein Y1Q_0017595 [Alligator mississippiensis]
METQQGRNSSRNVFGGGSVLLKTKVPDCFGNSTSKLNIKIYVADNNRAKLSSREDYMVDLSEQKPHWLSG